MGCVHLRGARPAVNSLSYLHTLWGCIAAAEQAVIGLSAPAVAWLYAS